jgi:hypothetical protein
VLPPPPAGTPILIQAVDSTLNDNNGISGNNYHAALAGVLDHDADVAYEMNCLGTESLEAKTPRASQASIPVARQCEGRNSAWCGGSFLGAVSTSWQRGSFMPTFRTPLCASA